MKNDLACFAVGGKETALCSNAVGMYVEQKLKKGIERLLVGITAENARKGNQIHIRHFFHDDRLFSLKRDLYRQGIRGYKAVVDAQTL